MEIREYFKIFKKRKKIIIGMAAATILSALVFSLLVPVSYEASFSFLVSRSGADPSTDYKYDDYYALMATDLAAETVEQWLKNPEAVQSIYNDAQVDGKFASLKEMARKFKVTKLTAQLVEIRLKTEKYNDAKKIAESASKILKNKISLLNNLEKKNEAFRIIDSAPIILEVKPNLALNLIIAGFFGLVMGIFAALGKEYFE